MLKKSSRSGSHFSDSGRNPENLTLPDNMDIELLPIVKDLCREAINRESNQKIIHDSIDNQRPKKKLSKKVSLNNLISKFHHHHPSNEPKLSKTFNKSSVSPIIPYETPQNFNKSTLDSIPYEAPQNFNEPTLGSIPYEASQTSNKTTLNSISHEASETFDQSTLDDPIPHEAPQTFDQSTLDDYIPYEAPQTSAEVNTQKIISDRSPLKSIPPTSQVQDNQYYMPPPNKKIIGDGNRIKVKTSSGKIYEVDRWCPHAKTDLNARGVVIGSKLFCVKHKWAFDLENALEKPFAICASRVLTFTTSYFWISPVTRTKNVAQSS
ncbi:10323_t:CDS:2 [Dentiscutata erythropus]|uniref:10323_t:CDS:1 n=1 Tax=Dentiscutata erythropus TaxID=1348616 RepID=A0A9N9HTA4_9GLOM|nr:10323_t:CDS:2 [Dentiscutata erythropus]